MKIGEVQNEILKKHNMNHMVYSEAEFTTKGKTFTIGMWFDKRTGKMWTHTAMIDEILRFIRSEILLAPLNKYEVEIKQKYKATFKIRPIRQWTPKELEELISYKELYGSGLTDRQIEEKFYLKKREEFHKKNQLVEPAKVEKPKSTKPKRRMRKMTLSK